MSHTPKVATKCLWREDEDGNWDTDCDNKHILFDGTPREHRMRFCCYCGKPLGERRYEEPHDVSPPATASGLRRT